jgi:hypothetical protein
MLGRLLIVGLSVGVYYFYYIKHTPAHIILSAEALGAG